MTDKNSNLLSRVVTALILLPLVIWIIWLGGVWFALLLGAAAAFCALELNLLPASLPAQALDKESAPGERPQRARKHGLISGEIEELEIEGATLTGAAIVSMGGAFLLPLLVEVRFGWVTPNVVLAAVLMVAFTDTLLFEEEVVSAPRRLGLAVLGTVYPGLLLSALVRLRQHERGEWWIILALTVTWMNDTCAYFAGRAFGRHKLYERISPSKTWEGAIGGGLGSIFGALVVQHFWLPQLHPSAAALIGLGAALLGPLGDLSESMLKRSFSAKDSGHLLPGHGGMLDRIDALIFNAPFVLLCARLFT